MALPLDSGPQGVLEAWAALLLCVPTLEVNFDKTNLKT